jgi:NADH dehydrogenase
MQAGRYVARHIRRGGNAPPFRYRDKGQLAVIGRNRAVAEFGSFRFAGFPAWLLWVFVHIMYLIGYDNRVLVLVQWAFDYVTRKRGARLITATGDDA